MTQKSGIQAAVERYDGSPTRFAEALGKGVLRQHVEHWLKVGRVSPERCPDVSALTGIPCEELNDRVDWKLASDLRRGALRRRAAPVGERQAA